MPSKKYSIGSTPLKPARINREFLKTAKKAVGNSAVRKGKKAALELLKNWTPESPLSPEDFQLFDDYTETVSDRYQDLESQWWTLHKADEEGNVPKKEAIREKMALEGEVLHHHATLETELREAGARSAVQALAGTLSGPAGIVAAYSAYANPSNWSGPQTEDTKAVYDEIKALADGTSNMVTEGNSVTQVHRAELWKAMNHLLDESIKKAESGQPVEVDLQLYELTSADLIKKVALSAKAGNKVRVNIDAGRLAFPSKDAEGDTYFSLDATPDKIRTILQLAELPGGDVGVSLFPQKKQLNSPTDLMHRKVIRVGNEVLISGMNANLGSGENIDSGYVVRGKAAVKLAENLARDIQDSKGATLEDIWGENHIEKFKETNLRLGQRGFLSLLDSLAGPSPAGEKPPKLTSVKKLEALARKGKVEFRDLIELSPDDDYENEVDKMLNGRNHLQLSSKGKQLLQSLIERAIDVSNTEKNHKRLDDMDLPSSRKSGNARVDVADTPVEREALVLSAISQADDFIYLPGFVVTRAVAAALAARRDQVAESGKELDIRVIADAGIYPHGGNPNSYGVKMLEDHGINPRWAKLERSGSHDRKIHAKQLITEKGEITGSTNFSNRGLRQNWETSAFVHFDKSDKKSLRAREQSTKQFQELWNDSYQLNSIEHAEMLNAKTQDTTGHEWFVQDSRERAIRHVLRLIGNYERETGNLHQELLNDNKDIQERHQSLEAAGYSYGDSVLQAVESHLGKDVHRSMLAELKTSNSLDLLQHNVEAYRNGEQTEQAELEEFAADEDFIVA